MKKWLKIIFLIVCLSLAFLLGYVMSNKDDKDGNKTLDNGNNIPSKMVYDETLKINYSNNFIYIEKEYLDDKTKLSAIDKFGKKFLLEINPYLSFNSFSLDNDILYYSDQEYMLHSYDLKSQKDTSLGIKLVNGFWNMVYITDGKIGIFSDTDDIFSFRVYNINTKEVQKYDVKVGFEQKIFKNNYLYYLTSQRQLRRVNIITQKDEKILDQIYVYNFENDYAIYQKDNDSNYYILNYENLQSEVLALSEIKFDVQFAISDANNYFAIKDRNKLIKVADGVENVLYETSEDTFINMYKLVNHYLILEEYKETTDHCDGYDICDPEMYDIKYYVMDLQTNHYKIFL